MSWSPSRRTLFTTAGIAGAALLGAAAVAVPELMEVAQLVVPVSSEPAPIPTGLIFKSGTLSTTHWPGGKPYWGVVIPPNAKGTIIALQGTGSDAKKWFEYYDAPSAAMQTGMAIAAIDGGDYWWHDRASGVEGADLVLEDLLTAARAAGAPTERIGFTGLSSGGYGALLLATMLPRERVVGVAAMSPAVWKNWADAKNEDGWDDEANFNANDIYQRTAALDAMPVWLCCGKQDHYYPNVQSVAAALPNAQTLFDTGVHQDSYWRDHLPLAAAFLAAQV
ncbi:MAG: alpha/beta hydrolase-fold protein [Propionibacteriaceae bacterium]|nr:hypothetical protein [Micropruina sp.]HBX80296.1 hypothetical protein [Propionibacteriaceae bacterium]HBY22518.1 hypothetical protein [Propionibacteriaceae bacterium]